MWRQLLRVWVMASFVVVSALAQERDGESRLQISVLVYNHAGVEPTTLLTAETTAAKVYEEAGVAVVWKNCPQGSEGDRCEQTADLDQLVLNIAHQSHVDTVDTFGVAFSGRDGFGTVCNVFYDQIAELHRFLELHRRFPRAPEATILGIIIAHELGHLLLGSKSHSATGVMQPVWRHQEFISTEFWVIKFDHEQVKKIHDRLRQIRLMARAHE